MTNASKAPPLREWPDDVNTVFADWWPTIEGADPLVSYFVARTDRKEYERQCEEDARYVAMLADMLDAGHSAFESRDLERLRAIAARIRENAG